MIQDQDTPPLPPGWTWTTLGEIGVLVRGVSYTKGESSKHPAKGLLPILRANNINGEINFDDLVFVPAERVDDEQRVKAGDVVIAMSSGSKDLVGKAAIAKSDFDGGFGAFCGVFRGSDKLNRLLLGYFFQTQSYRQAISSFSSGVNINNLRRQNIESIRLPLPPLPEQHRIVAKIEALFSELDKGVEQLKTAQQQLKVYHQSVLKWAFEGRLTEQWRKSEIRNSKSETARELIERIRREREERAKAAGKKLKPIPPLSEKELAELPRLPEGWVWVRFGDVVQSFRRGPFGSTVRKEFFVPFGVKVYEQQNAIYKSEKLGRYFITKEKFRELDSFEVNPGDYVVSCSGTIGRIFKLPKGAPTGIINQALLRIRILSSILTHGFFVNLFESTSFQRRILKDAKGTAMVNIAGIKDLGLTPFPICSRDQQHQVVEEIETRLSVCDKLEETIAESLQQAEALRQSILKKAFEGKLVPQDPNDEPASVLLERIKKERETNITGKTKRGKNGKQMAFRRKAVHPPKRI